MEYRIMTRGAVSYHAILLSLLRCLRFLLFKPILAALCNIALVFHDSVLHDSVFPFSPRRVSRFALMRDRKRGQETKKSGSIPGRGSSPIKAHKESKLSGVESCEWVAVLATARRLIARRHHLAGVYRNNPLTTSFR
jgi:hypothetical protein